MAGLAGFSYKIYYQEVEMNESEKTNSISNGKTQSYDNSINITEGYNSFSNRTEAYDSVSTDRTACYSDALKERTDQDKAHNIKPGDEVELKGIKYHLDSIISGHGKTLEAVIYKISDADGKEYALKLYYKFINPKDEPNPEALERIKKIKDPDILRLYEYGTSENKYQGKYCFEISDYARGFDLLSVPDIKEKYTPEFIKSNVIPEILKGITTLHNSKIYHCDLKPQNVFFLDEAQNDLVIGDYGSAKTFEETSEKEISHTSFMKGTNFYIAPEQARGIVSSKNDYYSFGMILLHLTYPDLVNQTSLKKIIERQYAKKPIIDYDPKYSEINNLIAGLTLIDSTYRWGKKEVNAWINNDTVEVKYSIEAKIKPIKLGAYTIRSIYDLVLFVKNDPKLYYDYLIEDEEGYRLLLQFIYEVFDLGKKRDFDRAVRSYQQDGEPFLKQFLLRYFEDPNPINIEMKSYDLNKSQNLLNLAILFFNHLNDISSFTSIEKLKLYVFQFELVLRQVALSSNKKKTDLIKSIIKQITSVLSLPLDMNFENFICRFHDKIEGDTDIFNVLYALYEIEWQILQSSSFPFGNKQVKSPKELASLIDNNPDNKMMCIKFLSNSWIQKWLIATQYLTEAEKIDRIIKDSDKDWDQCVEEVLHILDPDLSWPKVTSSHNKIKLGRLKNHSSKTVDIKFYNSERGFLAGKIFLEGNGKAISIDEDKIHGKPLALSLTANPNDLPVGSTQKIQLWAQTNGGNIAIPVSYRVVAPLFGMFSRSLLFAFSCAIIFGIYRLIIDESNIPYPWLRRWHTDDQIETLMSYPIILIMMVVFIALMYMGIYLLKYFSQKS